MASATHGAAADSNLVAALIVALGRAVRRLLRPARSGAKSMSGAARDLTRARSELMVENTLLRQQLIVLLSRIEWSRLHRDDRVRLLAPWPGCAADGETNAKLRISLVMNRTP